MKLYDYFEHACSEFSRRVAITEKSNSYTYKELSENVNRIAGVITALTNGNSGNICIYMNKSLDYISSIFAIYKCNSTFVPIEKGTPASKIEYILKDTNALLVISDSDKAINSQVSWVNLKSGKTIVRQDNYCIARTNVDVAYILYTSGTTGDPKGIEITHDAAYSFIEWAQQELAIKATDIFASHAPFSFDLSVFDIYCSLFNGAKLVLMQRGINAFVKSVKNYIISNNISIWYSVPSIIIKLLENDDGNTFKSLRLLVYAGESMPYKYINQLNRLYPNLSIYNFYGPTETNVITYYKVRKDISYTQEIPIGIPCPYAEISIVKEDGSKAKAGDIGELCVKSKSLMKGYHRQIPQGSLFYTGDLVKSIGDSDECFTFIGRKDNMVKINGFRVELEEIEAAIENCPGIDKVIVQPKTQNDNDILVAYYTSSEIIDINKIRNDLLMQLQTYKIPSQFERVSSILLNERGKKIRER